MLPASKSEACYSLTIKYFVFCLVDFSFKTYNDDQKYILLCKKIII